MNNSHIAGGAAVLIGALLLVSAGQARQADTKPSWPGSGAPSNGGMVPPDQTATDCENLGEISPGFDDDGSPLVFENARVLINGVPLRDCQMGGINLSGVPRGSRVLKAFVYWQWACLDAPVKGRHDTINFGRVFPPPRDFDMTREGHIVGMGANPCWCGDDYENINYRADVTDLVSTTPAGVYGLILPMGSVGSNNYADPWAGSLFAACQAQAEPPLINGATLVVVYTSACEPNGTVTLYDFGLTGHMFTPIPGIMFDLVHPPAGGEESRFAMATGDGQVGLGYRSMYGFTNEVTSVNDTAIAGVGTRYNDSHWNGSNGQPLPQLFDVVGQDVSELVEEGSASTNIRVVSQGGPGLSDCVVPVVAALFTR